MKLGQVSVLMKFSGGVPGTSRKDKATTDEVKSTKHLGQDAGKWVADLYQKEVFEPIKKKLTEARTYHNKVTFPFGVAAEDGEESGPAPIAGIGILPAALIKEYGDKMRVFQGELAVLVEEFLDNPKRYIDWGVAQHNGTFNPKNYPGCFSCNGQWTVDISEFQEFMRKRIYIRTEPLPVPDSEQFTSGVMGLLGVDADSVDIRVRDASQEAQKELLQRMKDPILHMASKLSGQTCNCRSCKGKPSKTSNFKDSLVDNIREIAALVPKQNLTEDPALNEFAQEMEALTRYTPDTLREDEVTRLEAAAKAEQLFKRLSGYKL